jgi:acyl-CoA synthetase (AMP-forming)/AMP-acid ligase II
MIRSTMPDYPLNVAQIVRHGVEVHGRRRVLTLQPDGSTRVATFAEIGERAAQLAHALSRLGVSSGDRVATFLWNNQEHVEAYVAVPSLGAVLHTLNLRLSADELAYIVNHAEDRVVIVDGSLVPLFAKVLPKVDRVRTVVVTGDGDVAALAESGASVLRYDDFIAGQPAAFEWPEIDETAAAALCYTSGTTGTSKGVAYSHRSIYLHSLGLLGKDSFGLGADDMVLAIVPQFHANAWGSIYGVLMAGSELLLPDRFLQAEPLVRLIETYRPTIALAVPTVWSDVATYLESHPGHDISSLEFVGVGGSAVSRQLIEAFEKHGVTIFQAWGMTETSPLGTIARPARGLGSEERWRIRVTQGRPVAGVEARIVGDDGATLPNDGVAVGELEVRGPWVTVAYFRDETGERFHDGWLRTGDVARIDGDHYVTLTDRSKDIIKSGGEWISTVELEVLLSSHPDVAEASVVGVSDPKWQERPLAAVVVKEGHKVTPEQLCEFLQDKVASWWVPERWAFIDAVPRTSVGKFDKRALRASYAQGDLEVIEIERHHYG